MLVTFKTALGEQCSTDVLTYQGHVPTTAKIPIALTTPFMGTQTPANLAAGGSMNGYNAGSGKAYLLWKNAGSGAVHTMWKMNSAAALSAAIVLLNGFHNTNYDGAYLVTPAGAVTLQ